MRFILEWNRAKVVALAVLARCNCTNAVLHRGVQTNTIVHFRANCLCAELCGKGDPYGVKQTCVHSHFTRSDRLTKAFACSLWL